MGVSTAIWVVKSGLGGYYYVIFGCICCITDSSSLQGL